MKKFISCALILVLCLAMFAGCGAKEEAAATTAAATEAPETTVPAVDPANLEAAREYLFTMYKNGKPSTPADYAVVGKISIGNEVYEITWTADSDTVKFVPGEDGMVTVDVDDENPEEVKYTLTGTMTDAAGNTQSVSFERRVPPAILITDEMTDEDIVNAVFGLEKGLSMKAPITLTGKVVKIGTPYSEKYGNITLDIQIGALADKTIQCFRLTGEGVESVAEGDLISVTGIIENYKGHIQYGKGSTMAAAK